MDRTWHQVSIPSAHSCLNVVSDHVFPSFVVSNVGEFSRTILGSHFKHNNVRPFFLLPLKILS